MDLLTVILAIIGTIIAAIGVRYTYLSYKRSATVTKVDLKEGTAPVGSLLSQLLTFFWEYPEKGGTQASWAVKESSLLRGSLEDARKEPGLGVAIITTELALKVFGKKAQSRIDGCLAWALSPSNSSNEPPYLLYGKKKDSRSSEVTKVPDFRHSLAFAVILAQTGRRKDRLAEYFRLTLDTQNEDGGWPVGEGKTISEVFTVLYAIEVLSLCSKDNSFPDDRRELARKGRDKAAEWFLSARTTGNLWESGVLDYIWDDIFVTAWVLHRLAPIAGIRVEQWTDSLKRSAVLMIQKATDSQTWKGSSEIQRFRVEARIAASVSAILYAGFVDGGDHEYLEIYMSDWRRRGSALASKIKDDEWDVATASFILESLFSIEQMREEVYQWPGMKGHIPSTRKAI